jgi:hypothetical protein
MTNNEQIGKLFLIKKSYIDFPWKIIFDSNNYKNIVITRTYSLFSVYLIFSVTVYFPYIHFTNYNPLRRKNIVNLPYHYIRNNISLKKKELIN